MKSQLILSAFILIMVLNFSCRNNRLKTSEKTLAKEILLQENQKNEAERIALEKQKSDTLANLPAGFRYKEEWSVDPADPPVSIDFSQEIPVREIKLSYVASKVTYLCCRFRMILSIFPRDHFFILLAVNFINESMLIGYSPRPLAGLIEFEKFGFPIWGR